LTLGIECHICSQHEFRLLPSTQNYAQTSSLPHCGLHFELILPKKAPGGMHAISHRTAVGQNAGYREIHPQEQMNRNIVTKADLKQINQARGQATNQVNLEGLNVQNETPATGTLVEAHITPDNYVDRLMKYIPAEVIAAYMTLAGIIKSSPQPNDPLLHWVIFLVVLVGGFFYLKKPAGVRKPVQLIISLLAIVVWVFIRRPL
jgi:hypothetical protein